MRNQINYCCPLVPTYFYHVYNRTNNKELLFRKDKDYALFLQKLATYICPVVEVFSYVLIPNHFHLLIKVKSEKALDAFLQNIPFEKRTLIHHRIMEQENEMKDWNELIAHQFSRFFNSYSKSYNRRYQRNGNLLHRPFKRVAIKSDTHFQKHDLLPSCQSKKAWSEV